MTNRALAMPDYVASLIRLSLAQMKLQSSEVEDDIVRSNLKYENGAVLPLVVMCIAKRGWFRETPMLVLSIVELDHNTRAVQVYARETIALPIGPDDLPFVIRFSAMLRAMAWTLAATSDMGECVSLPGRPPA